MYLPRSTPPSQAQLNLIDDPLTGYGDEEERFITVDIHGSSSARPALEKLQTSAQVLVAVLISAKWTDGVPLKAGAAVTKDIYLWRFDTPHTHTVVFKTPFATPTPPQG